MNVYKSVDQFFFFFFPVVQCNFLNKWNHLDMFYDHLVLTDSSPNISMKVVNWLGFIFYKKNRFFSPEYSSNQHIREGGNRQLTLENPSTSLVSCCESPVWRDVWLAQIIRSKNYDFPKVSKKVAKRSILIWPK